MKKALNLLALAVCIVSLGLLARFSYARITGTPPSTSDIWCVGPDGAEVCVDSSGNSLPTTNNDTTLGTSSLRWATVYSYDLDLSDDLTVGDAATITGALTVNGNTTLGDNTSDSVTATGSFTKTQADTETLAAGGTITANGCGGIKRLKVTDNRTTNTTNTFTAPSSSNAGCIMYLVNEGGGTITLDNNALFASAGGANVVLGTSDAVLVGSTGGTWVQLGSVSDN